MENIFENAKFGDKFRTRDGRMAIYWEFSEVAQQDRLIVSDKSISPFAYKNGQISYEGTTNLDIIGKWQEPNIEKLAEKYAESVAQTNNLPIETQHLLETAYIAGVNRV